MKLIGKIVPTIELRDGKPYCPGCDGGCSVCAPTDSDNDVHVMPNYGKQHICSHKCWCGPYLDSIAEDGNQVWVHKDLN